MSQSWKNLERTTGKVLGGQRISRAGNYAQSDSDVAHDVFEIECKKRKTIYPFNGESIKSLTEAKAYSRRKGFTKVPLGVCQTTGKPLKLCYLRLCDLIDLVNAGVLEATAVPVGITLDDLGGIYSGQHYSGKPRNFQGKGFRKRKEDRGSDNRRIGE